jgi:hypothetical protein
MITSYPPDPSISVRLPVPRSPTSGNAGRWASAGRIGYCDPSIPVCPANPADLSPTPGSPYISRRASPPSVDPVLATGVGRSAGRSASDGCPDLTVGFPPPVRDVLQRQVYSGQTSMNHAILDVLANDVSHGKAGKERGSPVVLSQHRKGDDVKSGRGTIGTASIRASRALTCVYVPSGACRKTGVQMRKCRER